MRRVVLHATGNRKPDCLAVDMIAKMVPAGGIDPRPRIRTPLPLSYAGVDEHSCYGTDYRVNRPEFRGCSE